MASCTEEAEVRQCSTCEHWLPQNGSEGFFGRCCTAKSTSYKDITEESDGCMHWETINVS